MFSQASKNALFITQNGMYLSLKLSITVKQYFEGKFD